VLCDHPEAGWLDHRSLWERDGEPVVMVGHNYHLDQDQATRAALEAVAQKYGLELRVGYSPSWYYPGVATMIELWRPGQCRA